MGEGGQMWWKYYIFMYKNGTKRPVKTILKRGRGGIKEKDGRDKTKLRYTVSTFTNVTMYPQYNYIILIN
jgi:hypothetical protein